jgi:hypothetical protein
LRKQQEKKKTKGSKSPKKEEEDKEVRTRVWDGKYSKKDLQNLDRSKKSDSSPTSSQISNKYLLEKDENPSGFLDSDDEDEEEKPNSLLNRWVGKFKNVVGDKTITK